MNNSNTAEIMEKGMACLLENLGEIETERFILNGEKLILAI